MKPTSLRLNALRQRVLGKASGTWVRLHDLGLAIHTDPAHSMHSNLAVPWGLSEPHFIHLSLGDDIAVF